MKALPLILATSLLVNAGLVATVAVRYSKGIDLSAPFSIRAGSGAQVGAVTSATVSDLAAAFNNDDPVKLRDFLRSAGLPDDVVRLLVTRRIHKKYEPRYRALRPAAASVDSGKFWKAPRWSQPSLSAAQRKALTQLQWDERDEVQRVLGAAPGSGSDSGRDFLPEKKRRDLAQIEQDYGQLIGEVQRNEQGFETAADREKLRYLREEQQKDIVALLSPTEYQDYQMRESNTANQLRWQLSNFDASEDEYRKIFALQKTFDDQYNTGDNSQGPEFWQQRNKAQEALNAQIKDALGDDRYAAYQRSQNNDYRQLQAATARFNLPADTADRVYSLQDDAVAGGKQIAADSSLTTAQKKQALAALADTIRGQVRSNLGDEATDAFFANNGMSWLKSLGQGQVITNISGGGWSSTGVQ